MFSGNWREMLLVSSLIGIISEVFTHIQVGYTVLVVLIVIDTLTGMAGAIRARGFNSRGLVKLVKKMLTYTTLIITVRLLEIGLLFVYQTTMFSQIMLVYLSLMEAISIMENLAFLGVPIPGHFIEYLLGQLKIPWLDQALKRSWSYHKAQEEIEDMIKYVIPDIKDQSLRRLLEIKFGVWQKKAEQINHLLGDSVTDSNEMIYYRIMYLMEAGFREMREVWEEEGVPGELVNRFNQGHQPKVDQWLHKLKEICYSEDSFDVKREKLIDSIVVILYQTILDAHRTADKPSETQRIMSTRSRR